MPEHDPDEAITRLNMQLVGQVLRARRRETGLTQVEVIDRVRRSDGSRPIAESTYRALEAGRATGISDRSAGAIAEAFGWPPYWFDHLVELIRQEIIGKFDPSDDIPPEVVHDVVDRSQLLHYGLDLRADAVPPVADRRPKDRSGRVVGRDYNSDIGELSPEDQAIIDNLLDGLLRKHNR